MHNSLSFKSLVPKNNGRLLPGLYLACETKEGNLDEFLKQENFRFLPSLFSHGGLCQHTTSEQLMYLEVDVRVTSSDVDRTVFG